MPSKTEIQEALDDIKECSAMWVDGSEYFLYQKTVSTITEILENALKDTVGIKILPTSFVLSNQDLQAYTKSMEKIDISSGVSVSTTEKIASTKDVLGG